MQLPRCRWPPSSPAIACKPTRSSTLWPSSIRCVLTRSRSARAPSSGTSSPVMTSPSTVSCRSAPVNLLSLFYVLQWIQVTAPMSILSAVFQQNRKSGSQACLKLCRDHACNFSRRTELQEPTEAGRGPHSTATFLFQAPLLPCHEGVA